MQDICPNKTEANSSYLPLIQGFVLGQLSFIVLVGALIKFFIFGDPPSSDIIASSHTPQRRSRTLLSILSPTPRTLNTSLNKKRSGILRSPPTLTTNTILSKTYYNVDSHQPESLDWFNVLIAQIIAQFRADAQLDDAILTSLTAALNGNSRPDYLGEIKVTELTLGEEFPIFSNCRVIPIDEDGLAFGNGRERSMRGGRGKEFSRLQAKMDVDLSDFITLAVETKLLLNYPFLQIAVLPVALSVTVVRFSGTLSISFIPGSPESATLLTFSFLDDYRLDLSIRSLVGSRSRLQDVPKIAQLVESRLHSWFNERAVEPKFQQIELPNLWRRGISTRFDENKSPSLGTQGAEIGSLVKEKEKKS